MGNVWVANIFRLLIRRKCIWHLRLFYLPCSGQYPSRVSLFFTAWWPSRCRGEKMTVILSQIGGCLFFLIRHKLSKAVFRTDQDNKENQETLWLHERYSNMYTDHRLLSRSCWTFLDSRAKVSILQDIYPPPPLNLQQVRRSVTLKLLSNSIFKYNFPETRIQGLDKSKFFAKKFRSPYRLPLAPYLIS